MRQYKEEGCRIKKRQVRSGCAPTQLKILVPIRTKKWCPQICHQTNRWCGANGNQKLLGFPEPVGGSGIWNLNLPPNEPKGWCMDIRTSSGARPLEPGTGSYHVHHLLVLVKACSHALQNWYENMGNPHPYTSQMWVTHLCNDIIQVIL